MRLKILFVGFIALLAIGCSAEISEETMIEEEYFDVSYENDLLIVEGAVEKPSPCHTTEFKYGLVERQHNAIIIEYTVKEPIDETCAQVVSYEPFTYETQLFGIRGVEIVSDGSIIHRELLQE